MLRNEVNDGRLVRPSPKIRALLRRSKFFVDRKFEVSLGGALIFGPCFCCENYRLAFGMDPADGGKCIAMVGEPVVKADAGTCTVFQPTEEATEYAKSERR